MPTAAAPPIHAIGLVFLLIIAAMVRHLGIDDHPLWFDEVITAARASMGIERAIEHATGSRQGPLYFALMSLIADPTDPISLRLPSFWAGSLAVPVLAAAAWYWASPQVALLAAMATGLIAAGSPWWIAQAQYAQPHALAGLLFAVALLGIGMLKRAITEPNAANARKLASIGMPLAGIGAALAMWTAVSSIMAAWLLIMVAMTSHKALRTIGAIRLAAACGIAVALALVVLMTQLAGQAPDIMESQIAPSVSWHGIWLGLSATWLGGATDNTLGTGIDDGSWYSFTLLACILLAFVLAPATTRHWLFAGLVVPTVFMLMPGMLGFPLFMPKNLLVPAIVAPMAAGIGLAYGTSHLAAWMHKRVALAPTSPLPALALLFLFFAYVGSNTLPTASSVERPDWTRAARHLMAIVQPQDRLVFLGNGVAVSIGYALAQEGMDRDLLRAALDRREGAARTILVGGQATPGALILAPPTPSEIRWFGRIWIAIIESQIWAESTSTPGRLT